MLKCRSRGDQMSEDYLKGRVGTGGRR
jgi:hypothetical protein